MELIVAQYNKLYRQWLEGIIGPNSIKEYQDLCNKIGKPMEKISFSIIIS